MIGKEVRFEAVPKNSVGAEVTSGSRLFRKRTIADSGQTETVSK